MVSKANHAEGLGECEEDVPVVDKAVDAEWKEQASLQKAHASRG